MNSILSYLNEKNPQELYLIIFVSFFFLNIPFGYLRAGVEKLRLKWFIYLHIPIGIEFLLRNYFNMSYYYIPFFILILFLGQKLGAYIYKFRKTKVL